MNNRFLKFISIFLCFLLYFEQSGFAQVATQLDIAGHLAGMRNALTTEKFRPLHLRYLQYLSDQNSFRLLLDKGNLNPSNKELEDASKDLLKYFFIGLTLPNDSFWVNLRPDSPNDIIDPLLAQTDLGKILLEADLQLKKDTAQATSPDTPEGRVYWDKLYQKAGELFGNQNITIPTLTRPWIVPDEIIIRETTDSAYIYKATLKVMLEEDYLSNAQGNDVGARHAVPLQQYQFSRQANSSMAGSRLQLTDSLAGKDDRLKELNVYSSQLIRENIIPKLTKEINTSKRYAPLRQVYYSLILASWFKARHTSLRGAAGAEAISTLIDSRNLANLTSKESWSKDTYFNAYKENFTKGQYNIQEPVYTPYGQAIRSYFSGGVALGNSIAQQTTALPTQPGRSFWGRARNFLASVVVLAGVNAANPAEMKIVPQVGTEQAKINALAKATANPTAQWSITDIDDRQLKFDLAQTLPADGDGIVKLVMTHHDSTQKDLWALDQIINRLYNKYSVKAFVIDFSSDNSVSGGQEDIKVLIRDFARWRKNLGPAGVGVHLGVKNEKQVEVAKGLGVNAVVPDNSESGSLVIVSEFFESSAKEFILFFNAHGTYDVQLKRRGPLAVALYDKAYEKTKSFDDFISSHGFKFTVADNSSAGTADVKQRLFIASFMLPEKLFNQLREINFGYMEGNYVHGILRFNGALYDFIHELMHHADNIMSNVTGGPNNESLSNIYYGISWRKPSAQESLSKHKTDKDDMIRRNNRNDEFSYDYGKNNKGEDFATFGETYFTNGARLREKTRELMSKGSFIFAAKYLFMKYIVFSEQGYSFEYGVDAASPALTVEEVDRTLNNNKAKVEPSTLKAIRDIKAIIISQKNSVQSGNTALPVPNVNAETQTAVESVTSKVENDARREMMKYILRSYNIHWETGKRLNPEDVDSGEITKVVMDSDGTGGYVVRYGARNPFEQKENGANDYHILTGGIREPEDNTQPGSSDGITARRGNARPEEPPAAAAQARPGEAARQIMQKIQHPVSGVMFFDDMEGRSGENAVANELFKQLSESGAQSMKSNGWTPRPFRNTDAEHTYSRSIPGGFYHWVIFGGKLYDCIGNQVSHIVDNIANGPVATTTHITLPLEAAVTGIEGKEHLKYNLPDDLAAYLTAISKYEYAAERRFISLYGGSWSFMAEGKTSNSQIPIFISSDITIIIMKDGKEICNINPRGTKTIIINFILEARENISGGAQMMNNTDATSVDASSHSRLIPPAIGTTGGIDFRALPIVTQAIGNLRMNMDMQAISRLRSADVSRELEDIQRMVEAGISPSGERIKEYVQASSMQGILDIERIVSCIADILRHEEETCLQTEPVLKDIIVILESARSNQELKEIFVGTI